MNPVVRYLALASGAIQQRLAYRNAFLLSVLSQLLTLLALLYLWRAVYGGRSSLNGFSWPELETYLLLTFMTNVIAGWQSEMAIVGRIIDGSIGVDLLRPFDFQVARLVETLGMAAFEAALMLVVFGVVALALGGILLPPDLPTLALALVSFGLGLLIKVGVQYITCLLAFWSNQGWGIVQARAAVTQLFSGALVPLTFMPPWLSGIAEVLPFQGIVYLPSSLYLGRADDGVFRALMTQAAWALGLFIVGRVAFGHAIRKVTIQGG